MKTHGWRGGGKRMAQHMVYCVKLQKEAPGIDEDDIQGEGALEMIESIGGPELRQRIYENVSMEAWELWKGFLTMIMNEYRLNTMDPEVDPFILQQMEDFFFGEGAALPPGYVPPQGKGQSERLGQEGPVSCVLCSFRLMKWDASRLGSPHRQPGYGRRVPLWCVRICR